jgi:hypothetical protein
MALIELVDRGTGESGEEVIEESRAVAGRAAVRPSSPSR